ncbi:MAG: hypothetical protein AAF327_18090 [Cyanobacteria bacterium P01_A01_bin.37]
MPKDDRIKISSLGEWYDDLLAIDSAINGRSSAQQAASLLCSKLQEREERINARVTYLARKRNLSFEEMWLSMLQGTYRKLTAEELEELEKIDGFR